MTSPRPVRRHRGLRALVITVVVLLVLLVVADRVGDYVAERVAGDTIKNSQHLDTAPDVDIAGFPFLTQLATGNFDQVTVTAQDLPVGAKGHTLRIGRVKLVLDHVHTARDFSTVHADTATATATIGYADLSRTLGIDVRYAGDGRVRASKRITVLGHTIDPSISITPRLADGALDFVNPTIDGLAGLGSAAADLIRHYFDLDIPFTGLPFEVKVRSLGVAASGVVVTLTGSDITYSDST